MTTAEQINTTYSLFGAKASAEQAARAGIVSLSEWDEAEYAKMFGTNSREEIQARLQQQANDAAERRVTALQADQQRRADMVGGLATIADIDVTAGADLDDLPDDILKQLPWHLPFTGPQEGGNATTFVRKSWSAEEAGRAAKVLAWNVHTEQARSASGPGRDMRLIWRDAVPDYATDCRCGGNHDQPDADDACAWLRPACLGMCRGRWRADLSMEDLIAVFAALTDDGRVKPSSIGWLNGGERVFIQTRLADTAYVLGDDPWSLYLGIHQNYSGSGAAKVMLSAVRDRCTNTVRLSEGHARQLVKIAHVGNMEARMGNAADLILRAEGFMTEQQRDAERLAALELTMTDLATVVRELEPDGKQAGTRRANLLGHMLSDETLDPDMRRTGYGAVQSVNRYYGSIRQEIMGKRGASDTARLNAVWEPDGVAVQATRKTRRLVQEIGHQRSRQAR